MTLDDLTLDTPYLDLDAIFYQKVATTPLEEPFLIATSSSAAALLGLEKLESEHLVEIMNGTKVLNGSIPFAMCYAGHQFGYLVPRLGDGRAINLGKTNGWNLQLKGAGQTRYSRQGDGRAVLRSSLREFIISEAMQGLGIPTTRALALMGSNSDVARSSWEKGAMVLRLSPTWVRFGTFEYFYYNRKHDKLAQLADYVLKESFPDLVGSDDAYLKMFERIMHNTAKTIVQWQSVGFNHGVMNTDNMAIDGRTIDYGPFAFMDYYDNNFTCNHTDQEGRYRFGNQPRIALWNINMLARALSPIIDMDAMLSLIEDFEAIFEAELLTIFRAKLGLEQAEEGDTRLIQELLYLMQKGNIAQNGFFRTLSHYRGDAKALLALVVDRESLQKWLVKYDKRLELETSDERNSRMLAVNPKYILSNHILQEAIEKAEAGEYDMIEDMLVVALDPYAEHPQLEYLMKRAPKGMGNMKLSCSS